MFGCNVEILYNPLAIAGFKQIGNDIINFFRTLFCYIDK